MSAQERTEQATEKHLKSVRSKGRLQKARDLPAWLSIGVAVALIPMIIGSAQAIAPTATFDPMPMPNVPPTAQGARRNGGIPSPEAPAR